MPSDVDIRQHIADLIATEHELRDKLSRGEISRETEQQALQQAEVELDQYWDLLRQRQARRNAGGEADEASVRSSEQVEGYLG